MEPFYDEIGIHYSTKRQTDPRLARQLFAELDGATRIINIGAGTGSYEPDGIELIAVEPSSEMISQRKADAHPVKQASAEKLPFENDSFSHAMTVLSMHHWKNRTQAFSEINRVVTEKFVAISWDPHCGPFWLTRDYFPEIHELDLDIFPDLSELKEHLDDVDMQPLLIPDDCQDGFLAAFWKRPDAYLNSDIRQSMSSFSKIRNIPFGLERLKKDLESGAWAEKNQSILGLTALDAGYRLITARPRKS